jgi:hypothetical protein
MANAFYLHAVFRRELHAFQAAVLGIFANSRKQIADRGRPDFIVSSPLFGRSASCRGNCRVTVARP